MNPAEVLRVVDAIHRDKNIDKELVFSAIESALVSATRKYYGEEAEIQIQIDRGSGQISGECDGDPVDHEETIGRIGAQTAKQVIIQKIREAERDSLYTEYDDLIDQLVSGVVQRADGGVTTVSLGNVEAILPRSEQIPGESHHANERVRAAVAEVRKQSNRVKVILSRSRSSFLERLFEQEIPEIAEGVISIKAVAREPGYRSKVAVTSTDQRVDCVGACVGVRGNRIKNIVEELAGERIDIVRWNDDMQQLIPNALQPAEVDEVILCREMGRAIVLVREDQLSLAIGRKGLNVRLGSKLVGWDIEIMTREELDEQIERAVAGFSQLEGVSDELAEVLVAEGFLSYDDLSVIEPDTLMTLGGMSEEEAEAIASAAEELAEEAEKVAKEERRQRREAEQRSEAEAALAAASGEPAADAESESTGEVESTGEAEAVDEHHESADPPADENGEAEESGGADVAAEPDDAKDGPTPVADASEETESADLGESADPANADDSVAGGEAAADEEPTDDSPEAARQPAGGVREEPSSTERPG